MLRDERPDRQRRQTIATPRPTYHRDPAINDTVPASGSGSRVIRSIGWLLASRLFNAAASLVYLAALTRSLGLAEFGTFAVILATAQLVYGLLDFNTWQVIVQYGTPHYVRNDRQALRRLTHFGMLLEFASAGVAMLVVLLFFPLLAARFGWSGATADTALYFILFFQLCFRSTALGLLRVSEHFREGAMAEAAMPSLRLIGALIVAFYAPSLRNFLIVWAISEAALAIAFWYFALTRVPQRLRGNPFGSVRQALREEQGLWRFAWVTNLGAVFSTANQQFVTLATGLWLGTSAAGLFRIGYQLGQAMARLAEVISRSLYTEFNRMRASERIDDLNAMVRRTNRIAIASGALLITALLIAGGDLLLLVAGPAYVAALPILLLMACAAIVELVCATYQAALTTRGHAGSALIVRLVATVTLLVALRPLIDGFAANGAATAILLAALVAYLGFVLLLRRIR